MIVDMGVCVQMLNEKEVEDYLILKDDFRNGITSRGNAVLMYGYEERMTEEQFKELVKK